MCGGNFHPGHRRGGGGQQSLEYAVKAAYLAKFAPFIDWPDSAFASPGAPLSICVLGGDPFGAALDRAAASANRGAAPEAVRRLSSAPDLAKRLPPGFLYLVNDEAVASLPPGLRDRPIVTVTESGHGDGIISFVIDGNHVRFDIDDDAAARIAASAISSKLC